MFWEHIFLNRNYSDYFVLLLISVFCVLFAVVLVWLLKKHITIKLWIEIREYIVSLLFSLWIFNIFFLHFALIIWITAFLILIAIYKKETSLKRLIEAHKKGLSLTSSQTRKYEKLVSPIFTREKNIFKMIGILYSKEKQIAKEVSFNNRKVRGTTFPSFKIYLIGIIVPAITNCLFGTQYSSASAWLSLIENMTLLFAVLYVSYPISYYATVGNEISKYYGCRKIFKCLFAAIAIILTAITVGISFNGL